MKRIAILALLACWAGLLGGTVWAAEELKPIPAAEAEKRVAVERDALTELLWVGIDGYWHAGQIEDCVRLNKEIYGIDPQFVEAYTSAAWVLYSNDRDAEAVAVYKEGLAANPKSADLYFEFGFFYRYRKQFDKAIPLLRKAVALGVDKTSQHLLPETLYEAGHKQEALAEWRLFQKRFPEDPIAKRHIAALEKELAK